MKTILNYLILFFVATTIGKVYGQEKLIKKADKLFYAYAYVEASDVYKQVLKSKEQHSSMDILKKLGDCYYYNSDLKAASKWYKRLWDKKNIQDSLYAQKQQSGQMVSDQELAASYIEPEYYFRTAQTLRHLEEYDNADSYMIKLKALGEKDSRIQKLIDNPGYFDEIGKQAGRYIIEPIAQNSIGVDFAPSFYLSSRIVFSSSRSNKVTELKNKWNEQPYLDLYRFTVKDNDSSFSYPLKFSSALNSVYHESTSTFSKDGLTVYFTRNNLKKSTLKRDSSGTSNLKIYRSQYDREKSKWSKPEELPFNGEDFSTAHPVLSADGFTMYFASDRPGGFGMSDLYEVEVRSDGSFGVPKNMGNWINTEGRDTFPFITASDKFYFASDGHLGLGGLDLFITDLTDQDFGIINLGEPINSVFDDITLIFNEETKKGYFASNRPGGRGQDDIYQFEEIKPVYRECQGLFKCVVQDEKSKALLADASLTITNEEGDVVFSGKTNEEGMASTPIDCAEKNYKITVGKEGYEPFEKEIATSFDNQFPIEQIQLKPIIPEKPKVEAGIDLAKLLNLKPIYFASNKWDIRSKAAIELNKIVAYMKENKEVKIEVGSHTDSKGSDSFNLRLSERRAKSTAKYIISKGIETSRVLSKGYGESKLINKCKNGVPCSKEEHADNRRSEFIVLAVAKGF